MKFLPTTWNDIHLMSLKIARKIIENRYDPDVIIGILRGGYIVARIIADALGVEDLGVVEVKFYRGVAKHSVEPIITQPLTLNVRNKKVLIVDDVVDSGRTLEVVTEHVRLNGASVIKSAALFVKPRSIIIPDFYEVVTTHWVLFPWELGEFLRDINVFENIYDVREKLKEVGLDISDDILVNLVETVKKSIKRRSR